MPRISPACLGDTLGASSGNSISGRLDFLITLSIRITFEWEKEPVAEIETLEKKLKITASYKGKLLYHLGFDYIVSYSKLHKQQALEIIDAFSDLDDFNYIELRKMDPVKENY